MLIGEVPAYEEQNVTYGNQYEILQQERDGDSCSGHVIKEDTRKYSWVFLYPVDCKVLTHVPW